MTLIVDVIKANVLNRNFNVIFMLDKLVVTGEQIVTYNLLHQVK